MTILPKKKQNKNTSEDDRDKDHPNERYNYGQNSSQNGQISPNNRVWSSRNDDKRSAPDSDCSNDHATIGNSHLKRRHRNNRDRDANCDLQRSLISSVRTLNKSSINSPSSSPRDINKTDNDLAIPGCSRMIEREESEINDSNIRDDLNLSEDEDKKDISGYNSGDEYHKPKEHWTSTDWEEKERIFDRKLRKKGFIIKQMCEDGACLFRAVGKSLLSTVFIYIYNDLYF